MRLFGRFKRDPIEQERERRLAIHRGGRMTDASITGLDENSIFYSYMVRGVEYLSSQDITHLRELLPEDAASLAGLAMVKYDLKNPADSIVVCEEWSGLRLSRRDATHPH